MDYAIICDARYGHRLGINTLALVDRNKTKDYWWTSDDVSVVLRFSTRRKAEHVLKRYRLNNPRIVTYDTAVGLLHQQQDVIQETEEEGFFIDNSFDIQ